MLSATLIEQEYKDKKMTRTKYVGEYHFPLTLSSRYLSIALIHLVGCQNIVDPEPGDRGSGFVLSR
jgi:hypothetical protein